MIRLKSTISWIKSSLTRQLASVIAGAFILASAIYFSSIPVITKVICDIYIKHPEWSIELEDRMVADLIATVNRNKTSATDSAALSSWVGKYPPMLMTVYRARSLLYDSTQFSSSVLHAHIRQPSLDQPERVHQVSFADGIAQVALSIYPEHNMCDAASKVLLVICAALFLVIVLISVRGKVRRLLQLERETIAIAGGETNLAITVAGSDELTKLALSVDEMRASLLTQATASDGDILQRNEWVTALSHDLRTPMTALRGYLEIMLRQNLPENTNSFLVKSAAQTDRIKDISDMLFSCFTGASMPIESLSAIRLKEVERALADRISLMESSGFSVLASFIKNDESDKSDASFKIHTKAFERVLDNIVGNILSHGDKSHTVQISTTLTDVSFTLSFENTEREDDVSGQRLGLTICENLIGAMGGTLQVSSTDGQFRIMASFALSV